MPSILEHTFPVGIKSRNKLKYKSFKILLDEEKKQMLKIINLLYRRSLVNFNFDRCPSIFRSINITTSTH